MTAGSWVEINGERLECVESVEWIPDPAPAKPEKPVITFPTSYEIKINLDPETIAEMCKPEWFTVEMDGVIIGRIRNIGELVHGAQPAYHNHTVTADFEPAEALKELCGGNESAMKLKSAVFQFDDAGACRGITFLRERN